MKKEASTLFWARLRSLDSIDKLLLVACLLTLPVGNLHQYLERHAQSSSGIALAAGIVLLVAVCAIACAAVEKKKLSLSRYGFSVNRMAVISAIFCVGITAYYLVFRGPHEFTESIPDIVFDSLNSAIEEVVFRIILIHLFVKILKPLKGSVAIAVVISAALWSLGHVASSDVLSLLGMFAAGIVGGFWYYRTRSILLLVWLHALIDWGWYGATAALVIYSIAWAVIWMHESKRIKEGTAETELPQI